MRPLHLEVGLSAAMLTVVSLASLSPAEPAKAVETSTPVAFTGQFPPGVDAAGAVINVMPSTKTLMALDKGESTTLHQLPQAAFTESGSNYSVQVDPAAIPAAFMGDRGLVTFEVLALGDGGTTTWSSTMSARAIRTSEGEPVWVDALDSAHAAMTTANARLTQQGALPAMSVSDSLSTQVEMAPLTRLTRQARRPAASRAAVTAGNCDGPNPRKTFKDEKTVWSTIGTTYPIGGDGAFMQVTSSEGASYGIAVSGTGSKGDWSGGTGASASKAIEGGWRFKWAVSGANRSYKKQIEYRKYFYEYLDRRCNHYHWEPIVETGGVDSYKGLSRPDWTKCVKVDVGEWIRDLSQHHAYEYGAAVKFRDAIGVDLSIKRQYSKSQFLQYNITGRKRMCGNGDDWPAEAGKVMERFRR